MLNVDPVVKVNINIAAASAARGTFDVGAILGPSSVLNSTSRFAVYESAAAMLTAGFGDTSPEYTAAVKYFGVNPAPAQVVVIFYDTASGTVLSSVFMASSKSRVDMLSRWSYPEACSVVSLFILISSRDDSPQARP